MYVLVIKIVALLMLCHGIKTGAEYSVDNGLALLVLGFVVEYIEREFSQKAEGGE